MAGRLRLHALGQSDVYSVYPYPDRTLAADILFVLSELVRLEAELASHEPNSPPPSPIPGNAAGRLRALADELMRWARRGRAYSFGDAQSANLSADLQVLLSQLETAEWENKRLEAEIERLTPKPSPHEAMHSVVYRTGPITAADYDEAIADLRNAKRALVKGDNMGCAVCSDSGHSAIHCHHNPLRLARKWARASGLWQCWHCGYIATTDEEGREHFGAHDGDVPACDNNLSRLTALIREVAIPALEEAQRKLIALDDVRGAEDASQAHAKLSGEVSS